MFLSNTAIDSVYRVHLQILKDQHVLNVFVCVYFRGQSVDNSYEQPTAQNTSYWLQ